MKDWGRAGAYVALFSEIAAIFLTTTLAGTLLGWWVDRQLHPLPIFLLMGAMGGFGLGGVGVAQLIDHFLARYR